MASDASETLVLDQCALFALRCAVGAAQDREVSSQEIIGALRTAAKWALAHRHDVHSREEGQLVLTALDTGECPPPSIGLMTQALQTLGCRLKTLDNTPTTSDVRSALAAPESILLIMGEFNFDWRPTSPLAGGELDAFVWEATKAKHLTAKVRERVFDTNLRWSEKTAFRQYCAATRKKNLQMTPYMLVEEAFPDSVWSPGKGGAGKTARLKGKQTVCPLKSLSRVYQVITVQNHDGQERP